MPRARAPSVLLDLARACVARRAVRIRFRDTQRRTAERLVDVLALAFEPPRWVAAAWSAELGSLRLLDVARIRTVRATRRRCGAPPAGFDPEWFALRGRRDRPGLPGGAVHSGLLRMATAKTPAKPPTKARPKPRTKPYEARLLRLAAWILGSSEPVTRGEVYEAFPADYRGRPETRERMFTRDKDALKRLGFNVEAVEIGGREQWAYTIDARSSTLGPIDLAPDEAAAAWTAGVGALRLSVHPMREELESALRKLVVGTRSLPPRAAATEELAPDGSEDGAALLRPLADAWERRRRIVVSYWRVSTGEVVERAVDVYGWARRRGEWIFVGHCHLRGATRIFYLSRVRALRLAKRDAARQKLGQDGDYDLPDGFDIRRWSRQQIWDYDVHPPRAATVRFRGPLAGIAQHLLPGARLSSDGEGGRIAEVEVRNLRGLVRQALAWGPDAEVTDPPEGRALAREILAATLPEPQRGTP